MGMSKRRHFVNLGFTGDTDCTPNHFKCYTCARLSYGSRWRKAPTNGKPIYPYKHPQYNPELQK